MKSSSMFHDVGYIYNENIIYIFVVVFLMLYIFMKFFNRYFKNAEVNCWFCAKNQIVNKSKVNSFICTFCEQYNGFDDDGGYNKLISAQFNFQENAFIPKVGFCIYRLTSNVSLLFSKGLYFYK